MAEKGPTKEQVAVVQAQVAQAGAALAQAEQKLEETVVKAPYDGVITARSCDKGDFVAAGQVVLEMADLSVLEADMALSEVFSTAVLTGLKVDVHMEHLGLKTQGWVSAVNQRIDQKTRTFLVKVAVDNPAGRIKAGTFCAGVFHPPAVTNALAVPKTAVTRDEGRAVVWRADQGRVNRAIVVLGAEDDRFVEIRDGLALGQAVVIKGQAVLAEGDAVIIDHDPEAS